MFFIMIFILVFMSEIEDLEKRLADLKKQREEEHPSSEIDRYLYLRTKKEEMGTDLDEVERELSELEDTEAVKHYEPMTHKEFLVAVKACAAKPKHKIKECIEEELEPEKYTLYRENEEWWISSRSGRIGPFKSKKEAIDDARASGLKNLTDDEGIDLLKESACPECDIKKKEDNEECPACKVAVGIGMYLNICKEDIDSEENCMKLYEKVTSEEITPDEFFNIIKEKAKDKPKELDLLECIDELMEKAKAGS